MARNSRLSNANAAGVGSIWPKGATNEPPRVITVARLIRAGRSTGGCDERRPRVAKSGKHSGNSWFNGNLRSLFSVSALLSVPSTISLLRKYMATVNWRQTSEEIASELQRKVAIVGLPNSGKSTLFNALRGQDESPVSPRAGTTTGFVEGGFGPFSLVDTPGHLPEMQQQAMDEAAVVVYLLDASAGFRRADLDVIGKLRDAGKPFVVALNKTDLLSNPDEEAARAAARLAVRDVIPISAREGNNIGEELIPALIEASPEAALVLGRQIPEFRRDAANKVVRTAALVGLAAGMEPIPIIDIPIILGNQIRMVLRIGAIYGEPLNGNSGRELLVTVAGGLLFRLLAEEAAKAVPFGGDLVAGVIAGAGTWSLGQVAIAYFESGKKLTANQISDLFKQNFRKYRENMKQRRVGGSPPALPNPGPIVADRPQEQL